MSRVDATLAPSGGAPSCSVLIKNACSCKLHHSVPLATHCRASRGGHNVRPNLRLGRATPTSQPKHEKY